MNKGQQGLLLATTFAFPQIYSGSYRLPPYCGNCLEVRHQKDLVENGGHISYCYIITYVDIGPSARYTDDFAADSTGTQGGHRGIFSKHDFWGIIFGGNTLAGPAKENRWNIMEIQNTI